MRAVVLGLVALAGCFNATLRLSATVPASELESARADLVGLVMQQLERGRPREAFYVLEVYKTRGYATPRLAARDPAYATQLATAHQDLRPLFASAFLGEGDAVAKRGLVLVGDASAPAISSLQEASDRAFWEHLRIVEARYDAALPYAHVVRGTFAPVTADEAALMFDRDELFVSFVIHRDRIHAFVLGGSGKLTVVTLADSATAIESALAALRSELDESPDEGREHAWRKPAATLYDKLLAPILKRPEAAGATALYVSPDGFLANVPFAALVSNGQPLVKTLRVTNLPSGSVYRHLLQEEILDRPPRFLSIGNPEYSVDVQSLPFAELEAETLSFVFDDTLLLTGAAAKEGRIKGALASHNILHFATHGVLFGRALPGASSLMVGADASSDGFMSAAEIAGMDLSHTYLAVLSACETAVRADGATTDLASLTSAFMTAGVPSVIGSLWKVSDTSTTRLMLDFYREFLATGAGDALRRAQLALANDPRYQHPYYWAAFLLYGWDK